MQVRYQLRHSPELSLLPVFVFPGSNLNSVMHNPPEEKSRNAAAGMTLGPGFTCLGKYSLDPNMRELFHGLEVHARAFKEPHSSVAAPNRPRRTAVADDQDLPPLDSGVLRSLADEAGPTAAQAFIEEYLQLLPIRAASILRGLASEDPKSAVEPLVSLKVTSAMAGGLRLEEYCQKLEHALKRGHRPDPVAVKAVLFANIRLLVREATRQGYLPSHRPESPE
ncbi:Hpt domain-containing protein [Arthrobacter pascens]|uniref:Hpt domain-containing protein n=1 Tax=Arthrobacter pascens TaxID=1677 RepID=UPI00196B2485|nr:Hpt domain-containing protein [Arthrobacter pascens]MBN3498880.1 Hpt domain-containing protein [Arthrobacter pascens]